MSTTCCPRAILLSWNTDYIVIAVDAANAAATDALAADQWDAHGANAAALAVYRDAGATAADMIDIMARGWMGPDGRTEPPAFGRLRPITLRAARVSAGEAIWDRPAPRP